MIVALNLLVDKLCMFLQMYRSTTGPTSVTRWYQYSSLAPFYLIHLYILSAQVNCSWGMWNVV